MSTDNGVIWAMDYLLTTMQGDPSDGRLLATVAGLMDASLSSPYGADYRRGVALALAHQRNMRELRRELRAERVSA